MLAAGRIISQGYEWVYDNQIGEKEAVLHLKQLLYVWMSIKPDFIFNSPNMTCLNFA